MRDERIGERHLTIYQWASNPVCAPYRLIFPGAALNRLGDVRVRSFTRCGRPEFEEVLREADIFIIQRAMMSEDLARMIAKLNARGILVVYEIDDDLMNLNPTSRYAVPAPNDYSQRIENAIRACQCVQCSTPALAAEMARIHPEVVVLENQMDRVAPAPPHRRDGRAFVVGYPAGSDHGGDWLVVREAYNRTIAGLEAAGARVDTWIVGDRSIFESVQSTHKRYFPVMRRKPYLGFLSHLDLAIAPLRDTVFNRSKSDVKYLECAAAGTPVLASAVAYGRTIRDGDTGLTFGTVDEFSGRLRELVANRPLALQLARAAHTYVRESRLYELHAPHWSAVYQTWYERRGELLAGTTA